MERKLTTIGIHSALALALLGGMSTRATAANSSAPLVVTDSGPSKDVVPDSALGTVRWSSGGNVSLSAMRGKSVLLIGFVTWCPICNGETPEMFPKLLKEVSDKPVIVLTVATDVDAGGAQKYMVDPKHQLIGPNIGYGADPNFNKTFKLEEKALWTYAWIGPDGRVKHTGAALATYGGVNPKTYALPQSVATEKDLGKFDFITAGMTDNVKGLLWPMELGNLSKLPLLTQAKNLRGFSADDQKSLADVGTKFLDDQLARVKELIGGDIAQKIDGYQKASQIAPAFRGTAQGKELGKIVVDLNADKTFKKELGAYTAYSKGLAMAGGDDVKLTKQMRGIATRFPDTYYGQKAKEAAGGKTASK